MILPELSAYLLANTTGFVAGPSTTGTQIWLNRFPENSEDTAVALYEAGGIEPNYTYTGLNHERPSVQVISRSSSYATARSNANRIFSALSGIENSTLTGTEYVKVTPVQSPFDLGNDAGGRAMISCNYISDKAVSTS